MMNTHAWSARGAVLLTLVLAPACREHGPTAVIETTRVATRPSHPVLPGATPAARFGGEGPTSAPAASDDLAGLFSFDLPPGWKELAPTRERVINLQPAGDPAAAVTLSFLPGSAGGLAANVNRWRRQMGADALTPEAVAALSTHPLLNREATLVDVSGEFAGMGEGDVLPDQQLLGLIVCEESGSLFLKFTGPRALVESEREAFLGFAGSLGLGGGHGGMEDPHAGHDHPPEAQSSGGLTWTAPEGWKQQAPRAMREVTFVPAEHPEVECYIARLLGNGGGLMGNLNRWRGQFGAADLTQVEFESLPRVRMLGQDVPLLEVTGDFTGMSGDTAEGQGLLGVACIRETDSLFVKMTGPASSVHALRAEFEAFVVSLEDH
jgi:hypothetical protein